MKISRGSYLVNKTMLQTQLFTANFWEEKRKIMVSLLEKYEKALLGRKALCNVTKCWIFFPMVFQAPWRWWSQWRWESPRSPRMATAGSGCLTPSLAPGTSPASLAGGVHCWALQLIKLITKLEVLLFLTGNAFFNNRMPEETLIFAVSCSALML